MLSVVFVICCAGIVWIVSDSVGCEKGNSGVIEGGALRNILSRQKNCKWCQHAKVKKYIYFFTSSNLHGIFVFQPSEFWHHFTKKFRFSAAAHRPLGLQTKLILHCRRMIGTSCEDWTQMTMLQDNIYLEAKLECKTRQKVLQILYSDYVEIT